MVASVVITSEPFSLTLSFTFWLVTVGKTQVLLMTLEMALLYLRFPVGSVTV